MGHMETQRGLADRSPFDELVDRAVAAFAVTFNDTTSLDSLGIIGKQRVLVLEDPSYQARTRMLKAQRTLDDLKEVDELIAGLDEPEEAESQPEPVQVVPDPSEEELGEFDIRAAAAGKPGRKKKKKEIPTLEPKVAAPRGRPRTKFDKGKMEMRLRLLQQRREIMDESSGGEEQEADAMNIFFIAVTPEEFARMETVEISEGTSSSRELDSGESVPAKAALGSAQLASQAHDRQPKSSSGIRYEEGEDGEKIMVVE